jgi:hypothetical protein
MGFDERHVLPSLRLIPYDRLVLVGGRDAFRSTGFRRLRSLETDLHTLRVDPFDLVDCLESMEGEIRRARTLGPIRISATGGTKILTMAAILAAFHEGVEAWYCDPEPIRLPVLQGIGLASAFSPAEQSIVPLLRSPTSLDRVLNVATGRGFARRTILGAVRSLVAKGLVEQGIESGRTVLQPSPRFDLLWDHFREEPGKT